MPTSIINSLKLGMYLAFAFHFQTAFSQEVAEKIQGKVHTDSDSEIKILAGHSYREYFTIAQRFRYPQFLAGMIYFRNRNASGDDVDSTQHFTAVSKMNYDIINGLIVIIQANRDTVAVHDEKIEYFKIGGHIFLNRDLDIIEISQGSEKIKLGISEKYIVKRRELVTSNGYQSGIDATGATSSRAYTMPTNVVLAKLITYYISIGGDTKIVKANRAKVLKVFSVKRKEIEAFIDEKETDFKSRNDLEELVSFLNSIIERKD